MYEYPSKEKYQRALGEANATGGNVHDIYVRLGGKVVEIDSKGKLAEPKAEPEKKPVAKKAKKK